MHTIGARCVDAGGYSKSPNPLMHVGRMPRPDVPPEPIHALKTASVPRLSIGIRPAFPFLHRASLFAMPAKTYEAYHWA